jgi:hypothetical protein
MLNAFRRMSQGVLNQLGEDAFFDGGITPVKINIENGVQVQGQQNDSDRDAFFERDVATVSSLLDPKSGKTFVQNGRTYKLEYRIQDCGVNQRFVIMDVTA